MKILKSGVLLFLTLFGTMIVVNKIHFYYGWEDAFFRTVFAPFEDTVWAPSFSLQNFEKIQFAMSKTEITRLLGEPLRKDCANDDPCMWIYSWQVEGTDDFDLRWVIFNKEGKVAELRKEFFID